MATRHHDDNDPETDDKYYLGEPASAVYEVLTSGREQVLELARIMAELTVPSVFPPDGYKAGDPIPGNNQSVGAQALNTLASKFMFMAFPPGHPIMNLEPVESKMQAEVDANPRLYAQTKLALSRLEVSHRKRFQTTPLATTYEGYLKLLLVAGNGLWKHIKLDEPTFYRPDCYVVSRTPGGHPLVTIHKERVTVVTLDKATREMIRELTPEVFTDGDKKSDWQREVDIYSVCALRVSDGGEKTWCYWQEYEGILIDGSEVETDYEDCPMWPGWLIPVYGSNWGQGYCEAYRGDLFTLESAGSGLNDGGALAAWALLFLKPTARTSLRQVRKAKNLELLSGQADDLSVFRSDKTPDLNWLSQHFAQAARRLGAAFLMKSAVMRDGERVTKEEVQQVGRELDDATGGLHMGVAQGNQRHIIMRAVRLHEEEDDTIPALPRGVVEVSVVTGVDAMGNSGDAQELRELGADINGTFGPGSAAKILNPSDFATRMASYRGIKPDGLVIDQETMDANQKQEQQQALAASVAEKAAGPAAGALAGGMMSPPGAPAEEAPPPLQ